jgi:hypothetical protein
LGQLIHHGFSRTILGLISLILTIGLVIGIAEWLYPIIKLRHNEVHPPISAIEYLKSEMNPQRDTLLADDLYTPHLAFYLPDIKKFIKKRF